VVLTEKVDEAVPVSPPQPLGVVWPQKHVRAGAQAGDPVRCLVGAARSRAAVAAEEAAVEQDFELPRSWAL
jgi:hypothetical protein